MWNMAITLVLQNSARCRRTMQLPERWRLPVMIAAVLKATSHNYHYPWADNTVTGLANHGFHQAILPTVCVERS